VTKRHFVVSSHLKEVGVNPSYINKRKVSRRSSPRGLAARWAVPPPYRPIKEARERVALQSARAAKPEKRSSREFPPPMDFKAFGEDESSEGDAVDLDSVKALTEKLKLQTRRPSYLEWQERVQSRPWMESPAADSPDSEARGASTPAVLRNEDSELVVRNICGFETIDDALDFLRKELVSDL